VKVTSISVVVPTFNDAGRLPDALRSIVAQTLQPSEVIVADDGSTDHTAAVVAAFAAAHPALPVRYLPLAKQQGVVAARNHGIRHARGDWIAECDSDDTWVPTKLERQADFVAAWRGDPLALVATHGYNTNDRGVIISPAPVGPTTALEYQAMRAAAGIFFFIHSSVMFPRWCFDAVDGYSMDYGASDEVHFFGKLAEVGVAVALDAKLVHYRKRLGSMQLAQFADQSDGLARLAANQKRALADQPPLGAAEFSRQLASSSLTERLGRRRAYIGRYHYRVGAARVVNGQKMRGLAHLLLAASCDRQRVVSGVKGWLSRTR